MTNPLPRFQVQPVGVSDVAFFVDGQQKTCWHFGTDAPRPFFYPFCGPANVPLTRIGHPGAPNHDHHLSVWFAHMKVAGVDFWSNSSPAVIRQRQWLAYEDGDDQAVMSVLLDWFDGHDPQPLLTQTLIAGLRLHTDGGTLLELQSTFEPTAEQLELGQTNFGFLAVRVAKSISGFFGGGQLTDSEGRTGEREIFGKATRWVDYSGPIANANSAGQPDSSQAEESLIEGITYFDHPTNPGYPASWHVREDGWMGASACRHQPLLITKAEPLTVRYLLHAHPGSPQTNTQTDLAQQFATSPAWTVNKSVKRHTYWETKRKQS